MREAADHQIPKNLNHHDLSSMAAVAVRDEDGARKTGLHRRPERAVVRDREACAGRVRAGRWVAGRQPTAFLVVLMILAIALLNLRCAEPMNAEIAGDAPVFGESFWSHWGDGRAELAGYDLTFARYGSERKGVAVTIFVTEPFSDSSRVKADPGKHPDSDVFQAMKLNLVRDFPTGIYDYNVMTSVFVGVQPFDGKPAGSTAKISFSSQEWCGQVYQQVLFRGSKGEMTSHSYFDGEADQERTIEVPRVTLSEDALFHWARGFAGPVVADGSMRQVQLLPSLLRGRLGHKPVEWVGGTLSVSSGVESVTVPAGTFNVRVKSAKLEDGRTITFYVEEAEPHRIIKWTASDGEVAKLLGVDRLAYWKMNGPEFSDAVAKFGLTPRGERMP